MSALKILTTTLMLLLTSGGSWALEPDPGFRNLIINRHHEGDIFATTGNYFYTSAIIVQACSNSRGLQQNCFYGKKQCFLKTKKWLHCSKKTHEFCKIKMIIRFKRLPFELLFPVKWVKNEKKISFFGDCAFYVKRQSVFHLNQCKKWRAFTISLCCHFPSNMWMKNEESNLIFFGFLMSKSSPFFQLKDSMQIKYGDARNIPFLLL